MTHGWGGNRDADGTGTSSEATGNVGAAPLRKAGFNVLTWDSRGFGAVRRHRDRRLQGQRGPRRPGADRLPRQAARGAARRPRRPARRACTAAPTRAASSSCAAGFERRIDAIAPDIAWHSLLTSLYKEETVKGGWALALYGAGVPTSGLEGIVSPAGAQTGTSTRTSPPRSSRARAPASCRRGPRVVRLARPVVAGGRDPRPDAADPGHGRHAVHARRGDDQLPDPARQRRPGEDGLVLRRPRHVPDRRAARPGTSSATVIAWMKRHLAGDASVDTGPRFEWLADDAKWRSAADFPPPAGAPLVAEGSGAAGDQPGRRRLRHARSPPAARPTPSTCRCRRRRAAVQAVGAPTLKLDLHRDRRRPRGLRVRADRRRDARRRRRQPGAPDPARARRQAAHDRAPARGDRREPHAGVASSRCRSRAAARSTARPARPPTSDRPRRAWRSRPSARAGAAAAACCRGSRRCLSRRSFVIRLHEPKRGRAAAARRPA